MKKDNKIKFINKSRKNHGDKYDYSLVNYKNNKTKVQIIYPEHGVFHIRPDMHIGSKQGCRKCHDDKLRLDKKTFIKRARNIHRNRYDYFLLNYKNNRTKIKINCPKHGEFEKNIQNHLNGSGCPKCKNKSIGEEKIEKYLNENNILYQYNYRFENCKNKLPLPFDFYLKEKNICIEFDGIQHFKSSKLFGGEEKLQKRKENDKIKNEFCKKNSIKLLRINYKQIKYINKILKNNI